MFGDRFSSSTSCSRWLHETEPDRPDQSLTCCFLKVATHPPEDCIFQTCALGLEAVQVNVLSILLGGHVRTGMEDNLFFQRDEPVRDNVQLVERIVRIANDLGRWTATAEETRKMLGLGPPTEY